MVIVGLLQAGCIENVENRIESIAPPSSPDPAFLSKVREIQAEVVAISEMLEYGQGIRGALTIEEMDGQGNCGHFALLVGQHFYRLSPRGVSLYSHRAIHRVTAVMLDGRQIVVDGTLGVVYPYSIADLVKWPELAQQVVGDVSDRFRLYGPIIFGELQNIDVDSAAMGVVGSVVVSEYPGGGAGEVGNPVQVVTDSQRGARVFGIRLNGTGGDFVEEIPVNIEFRLGGIEVGRQELKVFSYGGRIEITLPHFVLADEVVISGDAFSALPVFSQVEILGDFVDSSDSGFAIPSKSSNF